MAPPPAKFPAHTESMKSMLKNCFQFVRDSVELAYLCSRSGAVKGQSKGIAEAEGVVRRSIGMLHERN